MFKTKPQYVTVKVSCSSMDGLDTSSFFKAKAIVEKELNRSTIVEAIKELEKVSTLNGDINIGDTIVSVRKYDKNELIRTENLNKAIAKNKKLVENFKKLNDSEHFPNRYIVTKKLSINICKKKVGGAQ